MAFVFSFFLNAGHFDVADILTPKMSYYNKSPFCSCVSKTQPIIQYGVTLHFF